MSTPGRPRDVTIDERALAATRDLLVETGFSATTIQAVAERSGLHASAIYRRWPSRTELIEEAVFPGFDGLSVRPTGDLPGDLRRFVRAYVRMLGSPVARAAIPGLLASYQATGRSGSPEEWLHLSARPQFRDIVLASRSDGVDPPIDIDDVFDMLLGTILARILVPTIDRRNAPLERTVELTLRLLQPTSDHVNAR